MLSPVGSISELPIGPVPSRPVTDHVESGERQVQAEAGRRVFPRETLATGPCRAVSCPSLTAPPYPDDSQTLGSPPQPVHRDSSHPRGRSRRDPPPSSGRSSRHCHLPRVSTQRGVPSWQHRLRLQAADPQWPSASRPQQVQPAVGTQLAGPSCKDLPERCRGACANTQTHTHTHTDTHACSNLSSPILNQY